MKKRACGLARCVQLVKFFCGVVLTSAELFFLQFVYSYFFWNRPNISWDPWNIFRFVLTYGFVEPSLSGFLENLKPLSGIFLRYIYTSRNLLLAVASSLPLHFPNDMSSWAHFLAEYRAVECASGAQPCFHPFSEDSEKHPTHSPVILRALSSSPLQSMTRDTPDASSVRQDIATCRSSEASIPCRDLSTAFEELYIEPNGAADTPIVKQSSKNDPTSDVISPVGVAELHSMALASPSSDAMLPSKIHVDTPNQESLEPRTDSLISSYTRISSETYPMPWWIVSCSTLLYMISTRKPLPWLVMTIPDTIAVLKTLKRHMIP